MARKRPRDPGEAHQFTYLGPGKNLRVAEGADPVGPGGAAMLTADQLRALMRLGHRFAADSQVGTETLDAAAEAVKAERERLRLDAQAAQARAQAGQ